MSSASALRPTHGRREPNDSPRPPAPASPRPRPSQRPASRRAPPASSASCGPSARRPRRGAGGPRPVSAPWPGPRASAPVPPPGSAPGPAPPGPAGPPPPPPRAGRRREPAPCGPAGAPGPWRGRRRSRRRTTRRRTAPPRAGRPAGGGRRTGWRPTRRGRRAPGLSTAWGGPRVSSRPCRSGGGSNAESVGRHPRTWRHVETPGSGLRSSQAAGGPCSGSRRWRAELGEGFEEILPVPLRGAVAREQKRERQRPPRAGLGRALGRPGEQERQEPLLGRWSHVVSPLPAPAERPGTRAPCGRRRRAGWSAARRRRGGAARRRRRRSPRCGCTRA